ncbi:MAG: hypothetical protein EXR76_09515 [Myxococcales bacterium]|nr:hypothetical protein [Myxococcales bacterium]
MKPERRQHRSEHPRLALSMYLEALRAEFGYAAAAVGDADGLLVAGTSGGVDSDALAAIGPMLSSTTEVPEDGLLCLVTRGRAARAWPVCNAEYGLHLIAVGGHTAPVRPAGADETINRILGVG